jgi:hypothetical protein
MEEIVKRPQAPHKNRKAITTSFVLGQVFASSVSNSLGLLVGHPFDTIKVRMQVSNERLTVSKCFRDIIANEGVSLTILKRTGKRAVQGCLFCSDWLFPLQYFLIHDEPGAKEAT